MKTLANVRVRNVATVGGNLAHADPHLDLPPVWMSLGAKVVIVGPDGERVIPVEDLFVGYYETTLNNNELIAELEVPVRPGWRSTYVKVTTRAAHDWPALGIALSAEIDGWQIKDLSLVLSAAVEIDATLLRRAGEAAVAETHIESDSQGSASYKQHLLRVHLGRAIQSMAAE